MGQAEVKNGKARRGKSEMNCEHFSRGGYDWNYYFVDVVDRRV